MYKLTSIIRNKQYIIHREDGKVLGFFQMFINGDTGTIYGLEGKGVFPAILENFKEMLSESNITKIQAVMELHVRELMEKHLLDIVKIEVGSELVYDGKKMNNIILELI